MFDALLGFTRRGLAGRLRAAPGVDRAVAEAMIAVPRHRFVRWRDRWQAYRDRSLPTGDGTSISQPTYIARVISLARISSGDRVLEIGAGSGYTAAVMSRLAREVVSVERVERLAALARRRLRDAANVRVITGDGGGAVDGVFDVIVVMAGAPAVPPRLRERLRDGGRLVIPVGERRAGTIQCTMVRVTRAGERFDEERLFEGDWNTLYGVDGWSEVD